MKGVLFFLFINALDGDRYEGTVASVERGGSGGGEVYKISIQYDDGDEEECNWSDEDVILLGGELVEEKTKKVKSCVNETVEIARGKLEERCLGV